MGWWRQVYMIIQVCVFGKPVSMKREEMEIMTEMEADGDKDADRPRAKEPECKK